MIEGILTSYHGINSLTLSGEEQKPQISGFYDLKKPVLQKACTDLL